MSLGQLLGAIVPQQAASGAVTSDPRSREIRRTAAIALGGDFNALLKLYALDCRAAAQVENALAATVE